jgi:GDPmannose 4,6-dehydratase
MHASTALMFNHVSTRRHPYFVDRKITRGVARIAKGLDSQLKLGQLSAARDWGWGPEYMAAWPLIAAQDSPGDYVLATGELHTVREFVDAAFAVVGLDPAEHVVYDPELVRPTEIYELVGDTSATQERLGWRAQVRFAEIVARMVEHDLSLL